MGSCSFFFCILPYIIKFQSRHKVVHVVYTLPIYCVSMGGIIVAYIRDLCANILLTSTNQDIAKYILCTRCRNLPKMTMNHKYPLICCRVWKQYHSLGSTVLLNKLFSGVLHTSVFSKLTWKVCGNDSSFKLQYILLISGQGKLLSIELYSVDTEQWKKAGSLFSYYLFL